MRGIESQAMVLCATSTDGTTVELVEPPSSSKPGDVVTFEGFDGTPEKQLNSKRKVWETIQPMLKTNENREAIFLSAENRSLLRTSSGVCTVKTIVGGSIK